MGLAGRISAGCDSGFFCLSVPHTPTPSMKGLHEGESHFPRGNGMLCACLSRVIVQNRGPGGGFDGWVCPCSLCVE